MENIELLDEKIKLLEWLKTKIKELREENDANENLDSGYSCNKSYEIRAKLSILKEISKLII